MKTNLNVIVLHANDIERTRHYFTEVLGFSVAQDHLGNVTELAALGGAEVALIPAQHPFKASGAEYWLIVPDMHAYYAQVTQAGTTILKTPHQTPFGEVFVVGTPDGHQLTFHAGEEA